MGISIRDFGIKLGNKQIFNHFNLEIGDGEFVCILGKSGCGKTVLLNSILANLAPSAGEILVNGEALVRPSKKIGMVYQDFFILPWLTLKENILLSGCSPSECESNAKMLKIDQYLDMLPKEVSIGTRQRTSIARALATNADIILMDEPLCSVDAINGLQIRKDLKNLCADKTIVYITHDVHEALFLSSRIVCLGEGNLITFDRNNKSLHAEEILKCLT